MKPTEKDSDLVGVLRTGVAPSVSDTAQPSLNLAEKPNAPSSSLILGEERLTPLLLLRLIVFALVWPLLAQLCGSPGLLLLSVRCAPKTVRQLPLATCWRGGEQMRRNPIEAKKGYMYLERTAVATPPCVDRLRAAFLFFYFSRHALPALRYTRDSCCATFLLLGICVCRCVSVPSTTYCRNTEAA